MFMITEKKHETVIIKDPLYKIIDIDEKHLKFVDSYAFQRLRHIRQNNFVDLVYPGARHTRFAHSLGVYHLMGKIVNNGLMKISKKEKDDLVIAALFHDIGHGPFSHLWETLFPKYKHEQISIKLLEKFKLDGAIKILKGESKYSALLNSTIDVDKLDYMLRDSYYAAVTYGNIDTSLILKNMYIGDDGKMYVNKRIISSIEDLISQRINLFKCLYMHKISLEFEMIFQNIFRRLRELYEKDGAKNIEIIRLLKDYMDNPDDINNLLNLTDDIVITQLRLFQKCDDEILRLFSNMYFRREKFNVINLKIKNVNVEKIKKEVSKKYDLTYFFKEIKYKIKIFENDIYVDEDGKKIEEYSDLLNFYRNNSFEVHYVIIPKDIKF